MAGRRKPKVSASNHRGVTHIGANEAQGTAGSPDFSKSHTGSGFKWGIKQRIDVSKSASPMPKGVSKNTGQGLMPSRVWHPGAEKP